MNSLLTDRSQREVWSAKPAKGLKALGLVLSAERAIWQDGNRVVSTLGLVSLAKHNLGGNDSHSRYVHLEFCNCFLKPVGDHRSTEKARIHNSIEEVLQNDPHDSGRCPASFIRALIQ